MFFYVKCLFHFPILISMERSVCQQYITAIFSNWKNPRVDYRNIQSTCVINLNVNTLYTIALKNNDTKHSIDNRCRSIEEFWKNNLLN